MKGFLACMLATAYAVKGVARTRPLHFAFSYDEEIGCRGVGHMIARLPELCATPLGCIIGEPSDMTPVLSHKGKHAVRLRFTGKAAHSSVPDAGVNAIYPAAELALFVRDLNDTLARSGPFDARFTPAHATVSAGIMHGGAAVNIIPDGCTVQIECCAIPAQDAGEITAKIIALRKI
jgi:acetylornithine deacetylase